MKRIATAALAAAALALLAAATAPQAAGKDAAIARGKYLVTIAGCNDCHTPFKMGPNGAEPDMTRMLSGHPEQLVLPPAPALPEGPWGAVFSLTMTAASGPWGTTFAANLTPDRETGIGAWTEKEFKETLRTGRHLGRGRQILPPMPWPNAAHLTDADLSAMFAFLQSIPAIKNRVPAPIPPAQSAAR
ncbi:c-type cytochrome [Anaeromyxobacter sp. PSR-1]|uniref:c-type cytochrome n=1 Tax=unclassified Anaeromyxobacter TaxID=2620896 RepID=UPI0005DAE759|nr:c-type cytochrome [Anaeromyxobacter sp. PSR-1]GAO03569.1 alcohol dehydrogenase cytochrome c subunit [Anaeromyxobacter sp. PSR-1]